MKKISLILFAVTILLAGCMSGAINGTKATADGQGYSFEDPDIIAYVDGELVSRTSMSTYTIMKKAYTKAYAEFIKEFSFNGDLGEITIRMNEELIKETLSYSEDDWVKDYYKSVFLNKMFHETVNNPDEELKEIADWEIQDVLRRAESENILITDAESLDTGDKYPGKGDVYMENVYSFDVVPVIQAVANEIGISFEECVNSFYRPFYITNYIYGHLLITSYSGLDYGERVKYNGVNEPEYEAYVLKGMKTNKDYLDSLFEQVEIVERP